ncbi:ABC transporter ATP-binding protein [Ochrobactrum pecoris]|uniref:ABC transporter ATP-binding protein n=1 Tax=Brucella pecoris TaxID=867683 RepID=A0A5C5CEE6_9HYPH|nr:ABC transporter ATP-binding protein [Brucella pecoris]MBB4095738.1 glycerol transport system ATP-binding protein [Brucella pecoris]NKW81901.1 ABC transporter ATP-binding protein [Brucella pecoris]TNV09729.1 ABC transporter ATP-binding protein [Brucella pecoris]
MARITLDHIRHAYNAKAQAAGEYALNMVNYEWEDGGAYALLGPSGCGKTTLLNIISGLLQPTEGRILFDGQDVTELATEDRNIAQVFQFPVVYDTMTVFDNLAFPLRNRRMPEAEVQRRVKDILEMTDLDGIAGRRARGLTADQKQKISLGRGLVRANVNAILFDEPLTVIDPHMKWVLRSQLKRMHRQTGFTMVYVTHDQTEALTFADKVVVMHNGEIVQIGTPAELFERPKHTFVGYFIGSPGMNLMPARIEGRTATVGAQTIPLPGTPQTGDATRIELGIRPEFVRLGREGLPIRIDKVEDIGRYRIVRAGFEGQKLAIVIGEDNEIPTDPHVTFDPKAIGIFADSWRVGMEG